MKQFLYATLLIVPVYSNQASEADVLDAKARCDASRTCTISVKVIHEDQGWQHYANKWEILDPGRKLIATRELAHPHNDEQPFTRSLRAITIPAGVNQVIIRAHDSVHGYGGKEFILRLPN